MTPLRQVPCARCGRIIALSASSEASLVAGGMMVEFYYCADRLDCDAARRAVAEAAKTAGLFVE